jgi:hypothetical protein
LLIYECNYSTQFDKYISNEHQCHHIISFADYKSDFLSIQTWFWVDSPETFFFIFWLNSYYTETAVPAQHTTVCVIWNAENIYTRKLCDFNTSCMDFTQT